MTYIPSNLPKGQPIANQGTDAANSKPAIKGLASLLAKSLPQQATNNNTNPFPVNVPQIDISSLPPPMKIEDDCLPPSDLPPTLDLPPPNDMPPTLDLPPPSDLTPPFIEVKTNKTALDALPDPIINVPSIVITSPVVNAPSNVPVYSNKVITNAPIMNVPSNGPVHSDKVITNSPIVNAPSNAPVYSNKVITNSPVVNVPVFDAKALDRMQELRDRSDLGWTLPAVSKELNAEVAALAKKQGYTYDPYVKLYINGKNTKLYTDFVDEISKGSISVEDESYAKKLSSQEELESKLAREAKEKEEADNLALVLQMLQEEEEAKQKQMEKDAAIAKQFDNKPAIISPVVVKQVDVKAACVLSDDCIQELLNNGWTLDFDGQFGVGPNGEFLVFDDIQARFA